MYIIQYTFDILIIHYINNSVFPWGVHFYFIRFILVNSDKTHFIKVNTPRKNTIIIKL